MNKNKFFSSLFTTFLLIVVVFWVISVDLNLFVSCVIIFLTVVTGQFVGGKIFRSAEKPKHHNIK